MMKKFITVTDTTRKTLIPSTVTVTKLTTSGGSAPTASTASAASSATTLSTMAASHTNANIINVFTDGSCIQKTKNKKNRPAGYACVFPEYPQMNYAAKLQGVEKTNNRAEYTACIAALKIAEKIDPQFVKVVYVFTDSELMINSLTKWLPGWKAKGWKKADGAPVKNVDLLKLLDDLLKRRTVVFRHVKAHTGKKDWASIHNDMADVMAKNAALAP